MTFLQSTWSILCKRTLVVLESPYMEIIKPLAFRRWICRLGYASVMKDYKRGSHRIWVASTTWYGLGSTAIRCWRVIQGSDVGSCCAR